jgi:DDE superfamily endonuclease
MCMMSLVTLAVCSFDLRFTYFLSGWEGSAADSTIFNDAHQVDFYIPRGRYYLADAGFASSDVLLVPY